MKKRWLVILAAVMLLTSCGKNNSEDATPRQEQSVQEVSVQKQAAKENEQAVQGKTSSDKGQTVNEQKTENENVPAAANENEPEDQNEEEAVILENEGDIVITVPDDQEFGGE